MPSVRHVCGVLGVLALAACSHRMWDDVMLMGMPRLRFVLVEEGERRAGAAPHCEDGIVPEVAPGGFCVDRSARTCWVVDDRVVKPVEGGHACAFEGISDFGMAVRTQGFDAGTVSCVGVKGTAHSPCP